MKQKRKESRRLWKELQETRIRMAEEELFNLQQRWNYERVRLERNTLNVILNSLPNGVSIISADYLVQFQNKWLRERFGNQEGKTCHKAYIGNDEPCADCILKNALSEKACVSQCEWQGLDGCYYEIFATPIGDFNGKRSVVESIVDITDQKHIQERIMRSRQKYDHMVNSLNVGVYQTTFDAHGNFLEVNPALVAMLEADSKEELLGYCSKDFYVEPERYQEIVHKARATGRIKDEEAEWITLKGRRFWVSITCVTHKEEKGMLCLNGIAEDITERKRNEEERYNIPLR